MISTERVSAADRAVLAYLGSLARVPSLIGGSAVEPAPGILALHTGVRLATMNGVFVRDREPDEQALLAAIRAYVPTTPWSVTLRARPTEAVRQAAAGVGLTTQMSLPLLTRPLDTGFPPRTPPGVTVRIGEVGDAYSATLASGFEIPTEVLRPMTGREVLSDPHFRAVLVEEHGTPVATGLGMLEGDVLGVANIATVPTARRRGFGTLVTLATMSEGYARGARMAYLQSSPDGLGLYSGLGFSVVEEGTVLLPD